MTQRPQARGQQVQKTKKQEGTWLWSGTSSWPVWLEQPPDHSIQGLGDRGQAGGLPAYRVQTHGPAQQDTGDQ